MAFQVTSNMLFFSVSSPPLKSYKKRVQTGKRPLSPPHKVHMQVSYSMPPEKMEIFNNLESWAGETILPLLKPVEKCWQPEDFLPEPSTDKFYDEVQEIQLQAKEIPDDYFVCLVGNMITEEALPTYQKVLNMMDPVRDDTGVSPMSWAIWSRGWSAEENRHGDLLNKYLYLTGRVDMKMIEKTIQYLIGAGMTFSVGQDLYLTFIYTSFQERATFISHSNTARHAKEYGDLKLAQICGIIASDEKRHETAYTKIVKKLFEIDPDNTILALANLMQERIVMPAHMMYDGSDNDLFKHFCMVSQRLQVYTAKDYADVLEFLVAQWKVGDLMDLSGEGRRAQDYVCTLAPKIRRIAERVHEGRAKERKTIPFSWIHGREVVL